MEMEKYGGREAVNANFLKNLKNVPSRIDSFQDKPSRRESIKRYQRIQASGAASTLTLAQQEHQRRLVNRAASDLRRDS
jgi:hypothetical protein